MSILGNINSLLDFAEIPCREPDTWLMVKTTLTTAPPALLQLLVPGCSEIMQARLGISPVGQGLKPLLPGSPVPGRPGRRGRHGKQQTATIGGIFSPTPQGGKQFLYKIGFFHLQRVLWYWLVADVTTEFFTTWTSVIYEEQGCALPIGPAYEQVLPPFGFPEGSWFMGFVPELHAPHFAVTATEIILMPGTTATIMWTMNWEGQPLADGPVGTATTYLVDVTTGKLYGQAETGSALEQNGSTTGGFHKHRGQGSVEETVYKMVVEASPAQNSIRVRTGQMIISSSGFPHSSAFGCKPSSIQFPFSI